MAFDFDTPIDRRRTNCAKWDGMESGYGVSPDNGLAMWVADMDFRAPPAVNQTLHNLADHGVHGYFGDESAYKAAITNWMATRHNWSIDPDWVLSSPGLCAALGIAIQRLTTPDDSVIVFTPVYHAFLRMITANDRRAVESELKQVDGIYQMDLDALEAQLDGSEKVVLLCSPHNPAGRVWTAEELRALADFCIAHDLYLISDEVHHDLLFPGHVHVPTALAAPDITSRLITLTAPSKTFNIAGADCGQVTIEDPTLRETMRKGLSAASLGSSRLGKMMATAAYAHGAPWVDALLLYLDENRRQFCDGVNRINGLTAMPMQSTYLAWVDFSDTGLEREAFTSQVTDVAKIAPNLGPTFGKGGESFLRFNLGTTRSRVADAVERLENAFAG